jgi:hypothetical protein
MGKHPDSDRVKRTFNLKENINIAKVFKIQTELKVWDEFDFGFFFWIL